MAGRQPSTPVRTCIGCRRPAAAAELFRVVAVTASVGTGSQTVSVTPDPRRRSSGRGAWLHPDPGCVALASRRRAFGRALRVPEPVDVTAISEYLTDDPTESQKQPHQQHHTTSGSTAGDDER